PLAGSYSNLPTAPATARRTSWVRSAASASCNPCFRAYPYTRGAYRSTNCVHASPSRASRRRSSRLARGGGMSAIGSPGGSCLSVPGNGAILPSAAKNLELPRPRDRFASGRCTSGREGRMADLPSTRASLLLRLRDAGDEEAWAQFIDVYAPLVHG